MIDYAYDIKQRLTMSEVCDRYSIEVNAKGFARCCFHEEKTPSMKIYRDGYKCYGCGEAGDIITFCEKYFCLDFYAVCAKLNDDFRLGLPIGRVLSLKEFREAEKAARERKLKNEADKAEYRRLVDEYHKALDAYIECDKQRVKFQPKEISQITTQYAFAVSRLPLAEYRLMQAEGRLYEYENRRSGNH